MPLLKGEVARLCRDGEVKKSSPVRGACKIADFD